MKKIISMLLACVLFIVLGRCRKDSRSVFAEVELSGTVYTPDSDYSVQSKLFSEVTIKDNFWKPKIKTNAEVTIPFVIKKFTETGRTMNNNVLQAAIYSLQTYPDIKLQAQVDSRIQDIKLAQKEKLSSSNSLFEVAVAYYTATGKRDLLDIAIKSADLIYEVSICPSPVYTSGSSLSQK